MIKFNKTLFPYIILLIILGFNSELILVFIIVIFHETIHYITAVYFGFSGFNMELLPIGTVLKLKDFDYASPKEDLIISLSGPMSNLVLAVIFYLLSFKFNPAFISDLVLINLSLGLFNLIPALPLDGGRILRDILAFRMLYKKANLFAIISSLTIGSFFMYLYIIQFIKGKGNFNIGAIAMFIIFYSLKEKERIAYIIMGDIVRKKIKFISKGYIENKSISIHHKATLAFILSIVDKNKYNIFLILDDNMKLIDIIYEEEIIEGLKLYGNVTAQEFLKIKS